MKLSNNPKNGTGMAANPKVESAHKGHETLRGIAVAALLAIPGVAEAGVTVRGDLPTCEKAKSILAEDSREEVKAWVVKVCKCDKKGVYGMQIERGQMKDQADYEKVCGTSALSNTPTKGAGAIAEAPKKVETPATKKPAEKPKPTKAPEAPSTPPIVPEKKKVEPPKPETPDAGTKTEPDETPPAENAPVETPPSEMPWGKVLSILALLGATAGELLFRFKILKAQKERILEVDAERKAMAEALGKKFKPTKIEMPGIPVLGTIKAFRDNEHWLEKAETDRVELEEQLDKEIEETEETE